MPILNFRLGPDLQREKIHKIFTLHPWSSESEQSASLGIRIFLNSGQIHRVRPGKSIQAFQYIECVN